jgi:hypothetical protein
MHPASRAHSTNACMPATTSRMPYDDDEDEEKEEDIDVPPGPEQTKPQF